MFSLGRRLPFVSFRSSRTEIFFCCLHLFEEIAAINEFMEVDLTVLKELNY